MRLIDADALYDEFRGVHPDAALMYASAVAQIIKNAPEIDPETLSIVQELRYENKRLNKLVNELTQYKSKLRTRNKYLEEIKQNLRKVTKERDYLLEFFKGECSMCAKNDKCISYCDGNKWVWNGDIKLNAEEDDDTI